MSVILYVEDDALLQLEGVNALADAGYEVVTACDGDEATACAALLAGEMHALITDIGLLGLSDGWDVAVQARRSQPGLPVIYVTGACASQFSSRAVTGSRLVPKPYHWERILELVAELSPGSNAPISVWPPSQTFLPRAAG